MRVSGGRWCWDTGSRVECDDDDDDDDVAGRCNFVTRRQDLSPTPSASSVLRSGEYHWHDRQHAAVTFKEWRFTDLTVQKVSVDATSETCTPPPQKSAFEFAVTLNFDLLTFKIFSTMLA